MDLFGIMDIDTTKEVRLGQEGQLRNMAFVLSILLIGASVSCCFWTFDSVREKMREKSPFERDQAYMKRHIGIKTGRP